MPGCTQSLVAALGLFCFALAETRGAEEPVSPADGEAFFEKRIRPVLADRCLECHSADKKKGGLRLDLPGSIQTGGESGPAIVPGNPDQSLLIRAIRYKDEHLQMPPKQKLPENIIADFESWVRLGAPGPTVEAAPAQSKGGINFEKAREFWAFQAPKKHSPPPVHQLDWPRRRIDWFVLARLDESGLQPSSRADARTLIRRATFGLTGLPPSLDEINEFANDAAPDAYERLIERLLASPQYGERWARFWLDKARYTDARPGFGESRAAPWLYRDWVIRAFQNDMPYDEFVKRQLAADLMPHTGPEDRAALGFFGLSPTYWKELKLQKGLIQTVVAEEWEERMDALGRTFLGLTLACARCHDHKYDPISQEDYYAVAGVLASSRMIDRPLIPDEQFEPVAQARKKVGELEDELEKLRKKNGAAEKENTSKEVDATAKTRIAAIEEEIRNLKSSTTGYDQPIAGALVDAALYVLEDGPNRTKLDYRTGEARDLPIHLRGNPSNEGPIVQRGFLQVFSPQGRRQFQNGSGRLELAESIVREGAPLSARVIVNRIWEQHFGRGLIDTPSNLGARGSLPTHPELLDDLTARFIENGWSLKWLHREILLSAAAQQSSEHRAEAYRVDPENRWLWRMNRRRLEIESWRDAMLAVSGSLDLGAGGAPGNLEDQANHRRTIYGTVDRRRVPDMLRLYDFPDPSIHGEQRIPTTTPIQQLFVLNSEFVQGQAERLAELLPSMSGADLPGTVEQAYQKVLGRSPRAHEVAWALKFIQPAEPLAGSGSERLAENWKLYLHALLASNEFMFLD